MSQSIPFTKKHKSFFLTLCEQIDSYARHLGDKVSPKAWSEIRLHFSTPAAVIRDAEKNTQDDINRMLSRCLKYKAWAKDNANHTINDYAHYIVDKFIELYPVAVVPVERKEETKTTMEINFLGTVSIKEALDAFSKLDFEHPSTINLPELASKGFIFVSDDGTISVFDDETMFADNGDCLLSQEEWDEAFAYEKKIVCIPGQIQLLDALKRKSHLLSKRLKLSQKFSNLLTEEERTNCRFEIQEIDRELDAMCQAW